MKDRTLYPCPCCGRSAFTKENLHGYCPECCWKDAESDAMIEDFGDNVDRLTLTEAKKCYDEFGVCDLCFLPYVSGKPESEWPENDRNFIAAGLNNAGWGLVQGCFGHAPDIEHSIAWFEKAVSYGSITAKLNLGNIYEGTISGKKDKDSPYIDYEKAYRWYLEAAIAGDKTGMYNVANMYYWGEFVDRDYAKAYEYFKKLARDYNFASAYFYLGLYAEKGLLGPVDGGKAIEYYLKAIEGRDGASATNLGAMCCKGELIPKDPERGFECYKLALELGDELAYPNIGYCYEVGQGVEKNMELAVAYYKAGADRGEENCIEALKRLHR